ncbi:hypothetical protein NDU88_001556 [Pleurodeles waltl]|uniref:Uncharacterized protein n=1 Tax=Pleurodeles waltl TaxID=8319 RepID=A0AAV7UT59_PLEWA|nr:hypothetical protein NDU88_001556 [Pleurodeles waltl]
MRSAGHQKSLCAGSRGSLRDHQANPSAGSEFRPSPHPVTALSVCAYYQPGPALSCRGSGVQDAQRETPAEGRERPTRSGPPAAERTGSQSTIKRGGGEPHPTRPPIRLPRSPLHSRPLTPRSGGVAEASTPSAHTAGPGACGKQPAPGLLAFLRSQDASSSQNRLEQRRQSPREEAPGARSFSTAHKIDYIG